MCTAPPHRTANIRFTGMSDLRTGDQLHVDLSFKTPVFEQWACRHQLQIDDDPYLLEIRPSFRLG